MRSPTPSLLAVSLVFALSGCHSHARSPADKTIQDVSPLARSVVDAPDRTDADRRIDPGRRPAEFLTFLGVSPGMRIGEVIAGAGYSAELLARAVAPGGVVYAENPGFVLRNLGSHWDERLARPAMKDVVRVDREVYDPFPPEAKDLDLVLINLVYHETVRLEIDRDKMNRAVFAALKKGGRYAVIDHSARNGSGLADAKALHRIDESTVRAEVTGAGFELQTGDSFLRNPSDMRDWSASPEEAGLRRGTSDRFALLFVKP